MTARFDITEKGRAALAADSLSDDTLPTAPGLSAAYRCQILGCTDGTCARCSELREWGARSVCVRCHAPLEQPAYVFVGGCPLCGVCAGPWP